MSDSNFLNVEEIILLTSCLFNSKSFKKSPKSNHESWGDLTNFIQNNLNPNIFSILFGIEYYKKIIQRRNLKKNLVAATLLIDCLYGLLQCSITKSNHYIPTKI